DPESAALALAQRVSGAYVLGQLLPSHTGQAHLRGDIQVRGIGNFLRLDSARLDATRLVTATGEPDHVRALLVSHTDALARFFGGSLTWQAINFAVAPKVAALPDPELKTFVRMFLAATTPQ